MPIAIDFSVSVVERVISVPLCGTKPMKDARVLVPRTVPCRRSARIGSQLGDGAHSSAIGRR